MREALNSMSSDSSIPSLEPTSLPALITESGRRILWIVGVYRAVCAALLLSTALFLDLRSAGIVAPNAFVTAAGLYFLVASGFRHSTYPRPLAT